MAIYSKEDKKSMHRYKADEAYQVGTHASPVGAYLGYEEIVKVALEHDVDAIHPGYGFLSENVHFARLCEANGIAFVGPESTVLNKFGDKTLARQLAIDAGVPVEYELCAVTSRSSDVPLGVLPTPEMSMVCSLPSGPTPLRLLCERVAPVKLQEA